MIDKFIEEKMLTKIISNKANNLIYLADEPVEKTKFKKTIIELNSILGLFLINIGIKPSNIEKIDTFYLILNDEIYTNWHKLNWFEQMSYTYHDLIKHKLKYFFERRKTFIETTTSTLENNNIKMSLNLMEILQHIFPNALDSFSKVAYEFQKYSDRYPGMVTLSFKKIDTQLIYIAVIDNGYGSPFKKDNMMNVPYDEIKNRKIFYLGENENAQKHIIKGQLFSFDSGAGILKSLSE